VGKALLTSAHLSPVGELENDHDHLSLQNIEGFDQLQILDFPSEAEQSHISHQPSSVLSLAVVKDASTFRCCALSYLGPAGAVLKPWECQAMDHDGYTFVGDQGEIWVIDLPRP
jgi:hypothetical protein